MESGEPEEADLTTDVADMLPQPPELAPPVLEPLTAENHSSETNNASNPPTPISCCSKMNDSTDAPDVKSSTTEVKLSPKVEEVPRTNGTDPDKIIDTKPLQKQGYDDMGDMSESTITNLEDIITRTVMNSMMEDYASSPYNDSAHADKTFSDKFDSKAKYSEVDLISKFLASSDNEDEQLMQNNSIKSEIQHRRLGDKLLPSDKMRHSSLLKDARDADGSKKEKDEFEILKKKLAYSIDRGSWFSLFARQSGCAPHSAQHASLLKDLYNQDSRTLVILIFIFLLLLLMLCDMCGKYMMTMLITICPVSFDVISNNLARSLKYKTQYSQQIQHNSQQVNYYGTDNELRASALRISINN